MLSPASRSRARAHGDAPGFRRVRLERPPNEAAGGSSSSAGTGAVSSASSASSASSTGAGGHPGACTDEHGQSTDCSDLADACHEAHCDAALHACVITDASGDCDDKDPCTQGDYCLVGACVGFPIQGCCTPSCAGKVCGDDGCGGTCGPCKPGEVCGAGMCIPPPVEADTCDNLPSITLPYSHVGSTTGLENDYAAPQNACGQASDLGLYAPDAAYRYQATKDGVIGISLTKASFDAAVYVVTDCKNPKYTCEVGVYSIGSQLGPIYADVVAGQDYFIIIDGDGVDGGAYQLDVTDCVPQCQGKACGSDGCGKQCGECLPLFNSVCSNQGTCVCLPSCNGKVCGPDGCGGCVVAALAASRAMAPVIASPPVKPATRARTRSRSTRSRSSSPGRQWASATTPPRGGLVRATARMDTSGSTHPIASLPCTRPRTRRITSRSRKRTCSRRSTS